MIFAAIWEIRTTFEVPTNNTLYCLSVPH